MATIDVAMESSVQAVKTIADNIYSKVDTEMASAVSNTATNNTANKTGTLSQKESYTIGLLENSTYGLSALKNALSSGMSAVKSVQRGKVAGGISSSDTNELFTLQKGSEYAAYIKVTISSVNTSKAFCKVEGYPSGEIMATLSDSTTLRIYLKSWSGSSGAFTTEYGYTWQVVEFK